MKVQIINCNYSFNEQVVGKVFEAEPIKRNGEVTGYNVFIHFPHGEGAEEFVPRSWIFIARMVKVVPEDTPLSDNKPLPVFNYGNVVVLNPKSKFVDIGDHGWNPINMRGTVEKAGLTPEDLYVYTIRWKNGMINHYDAEDLIEVKPSQNAPRRKRQKPQKRKQTIVYILYADGKDYQIRRAKHVTVSAEHQALHVDTSENIPGGIELRQNSTIPFRLLDAVRVSTPDGEFCYYFTDGKLTGSAREFNERLPFKTQLH